MCRYFAIVVAGKPKGTISRKSVSQRVVLPLDIRLVNELAEQAYRQVVDVHVRGDAREPRKALGAIHEEARVVREIRVKVPLELCSMQGREAKKGLRS